MGHGWVTPNPNGAKARCGGPALCSECYREAMRAGWKIVPPDQVKEPEGKTSP
jgi:hypothetical protein